MSNHLAELESLNYAHKAVRIFENHISKVLTEHLGVEAHITWAAGDEVCIDLDDGFKGLTPLTSELFTVVMGMQPADAIKYIKDRSV